MNTGFLAESNGSPSSNRLGFMIVLVSACFIAVFSVVNIVLLLGETVTVAGQQVPALDANSNSLLLNITMLVLSMLGAAFTGKVMQKGKEVAAEIEEKKLEQPKAD